MSCSRTFQCVSAEAGIKPSTFWLRDNDPTTVSETLHINEWTAWTTTFNFSVAQSSSCPPPLWKTFNSSSNVQAHNTLSSLWCHSVIPRLRLTSLPNLIAAIMAWHRNKRAELFGGCALHDCQTCCAIAGYTSLHCKEKKKLFTIHLDARGLGVDSKDSTASGRDLSWSWNGKQLMWDVVWFKEWH